MRTLRGGGRLPRQRLGEGLQRADVAGHRGLNPLRQSAGTGIDVALFHQHGELGAEAAERAQVRTRLDPGVQPSALVVVEPAAAVGECAPQMHGRDAGAALA